MFLLLPGAYHPTEVLFLLNLLYKKKKILKSYIFGLH